MMVFWSSSLFQKSCALLLSGLIYHGQNVDDFQVQACQISVCTHTERETENTAASLAIPRSTFYSRRKQKGKSLETVRRKLITWKEMEEEEAANFARWE